jgi:Ca2+/Na+ antiporter
MKLTNDAKNWKKLWSVRLSVIGAGLMAVLTAWPDAILILWSTMPAEVKDLIPQQLATSIACFIFVMTAVSRVIKQSKLETQEKRIINIKGVDSENLISPDKLKEILDNESKD